MDLKITIPEGKLAIDQAFGFRVLTNYIADIEKIEAGFSVTDLGYEKRKAETINKTVQITNSKKPHLKDKIAVVNISGLIRAEDGLCSYGTKSQAAELLSVKNDVIGALFLIDSGGGYMDGAEAMIAAMREFGKPMVALSNNAGSAAYMIASECQQIFAQTEFSSFGSIGVYITMDKRMKEFMTKNLEFAYSKKSQNKNLSVRNWLAEDDLSGFIEEATAIDEQFMKLVKSNRILKEGKDETLSGAMFNADESKKRGLIDGISNIEKSLQTIQKLSIA